MIFTFKRTQADTLEARMRRARNEGCVRGAKEAELFKARVGKVFERERALDWVNNAICDGRADLQSQHALEREIEAWDMSCRIAFLIRIERRAVGGATWITLKSILKSFRPVQRRLALKLSQDSDSVPWHSSDLTRCLT
jgi:hypothetical protein